MLVFNLPAFENKKEYTAVETAQFSGILTKKEPIRMFGFTSPYNTGLEIVTNTVANATNFPSLAT